MSSIFSIGTSSAGRSQAADSQTTLVPSHGAGSSSASSDPKDSSADNDGQEGVDPVSKKARLAELKQLAKDKKEASQS